jgi:hypothetical protein
MDVSEKRLRLISPEPRLAQLLRRREPKLISREGWDWTVDWVQDVGLVMRDRGFMAYTLASTASYGLLILISELFPATRRLGVVSRALGIAER